MIYDHLSPNGRTAERRGVTAAAREQEWFAVTAGAPKCESCGHRMQLRPKLRETPWRSMKPDQITTEYDDESKGWVRAHFLDHTERRLRTMTAEMERLHARGTSQYRCEVPRCSHYENG